MGKRWTKEEEVVLSDTTKEISCLCSLLPNRTRSGIEKRTRELGYLRTGDALLRSSKNYQQLLNDKEFCQVIDGELLGDGCITNQTGESYSFSYSTSRGEYAAYLHAYLIKKTTTHSNLYKAKKYPVHYINKSPVISSPSYQIRIGHKVFKYFRQRWYRPRKIIPDDLVLSPLICKHWYIGDGTISKKKSPVIRLSTNCFSKREVDSLVLQLVNMGIHCTRKKAKDNQYVISISSVYVKKFLDMIGKCPVKEYKYKWDIRNYKLFKKNCKCGKSFTFFSCCSGYKKYCSAECQLKAKKSRHKNGLRERNLTSLISSARCRKTINKHYLRGLAYGSGMTIGKNKVVIFIRDKELLNDISNCLGYTNLNYKSCISIESRDLWNMLTDGIEIKNYNKFFGDFLRGLFDVCGSINKTDDNYYMIRIRHKSINFLSELSNRLKLRSPIKSGELSVNRTNRKKIFDLMYIQKPIFKSIKKYNLFKEAVEFKKNCNTKRDRSGCFTC